MQHPYAAFIQNVEKPARYVGGEYQSVKKDWSTIEGKMCLAFPDLYDIGMSHLGTKILYSILNKDEKILCERAFSPGVDMEKELRAHNVPLLSLESARPLKDFDVVGISLQYELTFTNALQILDLSGIPLRAVDRTNEPLIIGGGPSATHPEAIAPFFDAFLLGDAEEKLPEIVLLWARLRREGVSREEALAQLVKIPGLYVPRFYRTEIDPIGKFEVVTGTTRPEAPAKPLRQIVDINKYPFPNDSPVAVAEAIFDRMSIEIARGCTEGCRFCQAGMIYRPVRERNPEQIVDSVVAAIKNGGYDEVSITSLSTADYSCISPLLKKVMWKLREEKVSLSVSSLRAYGLDEDLLDEIQSVRATGLTFAPEAGTQRMREVIAKNISEDDLLRTAHRVFSRGWSKMKLYFMIGLPTETDEDVAGIIMTGAKMRDVGVNYWKKRDLDVTCSVSTHVPKPHTPFQWFAFDSLEEVQRKQRILSDLAHRKFINFRRQDAKTSYLECIFGRGDRRVADLIERAYQKGCRFDGWDEQLKFWAWKEAMQELNMDVSLYLNAIPIEARLPWDHLDMQLDPKFLEKEYKKTLKSKASPPCGKAVGDQVHHTNIPDALAALSQKLVCYDCGVACDLAHMKEERIDFLKLLGATSRPVRPAAVLASEKQTEAEANPTQTAGENKDGVAVEASAASPVDAAPAKESKPEVTFTAPRHQRTHGNHAPPPKFEQLEAIWYRLCYRKYGKASLTGHLDLVRNLPRIIRRAGLNAHYSQGFHPKPNMVLGPALKLGTESLQEYADMAVTNEIQETELLRVLNAASPEGIEFVGARRLEPKEHTIAKVVWWAEYLVALPMPMTMDLDALAARCALASQGPTIVQREQKDGKKKEVDVAAFIGGVWIAAPSDAKPLDIPSDRLVIGMKTRVNAEGNARPEEILSWLLETPTEASEMVRTRLTKQDGSDPLEAVTSKEQPAANIQPQAE
jgi:radical SAM family uncharacterized protein/radical SAM-linked protein